MFTFQDSLSSVFFSLVHFCLDLVLLFSLLSPTFCNLATLQFPWLKEKVHAKIPKVQISKWAIYDLWKLYMNLKVHTKFSPDVVELFSGSGDFHYFPLSLKQISHLYILGAFHTWVTSCRTHSNEHNKIVWGDEDHVIFFFSSAFQHPCEFPQNNRIDKQPFNYSYTCCRNRDRVPVEITGLR